MARKNLSASRIAQINNCHASADLEKAIPGFILPVEDHDAGAMGLGSALHTVLEGAVPFKATDLVNLAKCLEYLASLKKNKRLNAVAEVKAQAEWLDSKPTVVVDAVLYNNSTLHIIDWKTGRIHVEAFGNEQLLHYAATFLNLAPAANEIHLHIVQPWADNIDTWTVSRQMVKDFIKRTRATEAALNAGSTTFGVGDHCKFCPANPHSRGAKGNHFCPAIMQVLYPSTVDEAAILDL